MKRPFFSIIIATYNSEKTLGYTLESIKNQSISKDEIEVIVVDGGSTDRTREIANSYGTIVLDNEMKLPEYAKTIGVANATGHFVMRMDSDEEFSYRNQLDDKMQLLIDNPEVKIVIPNNIVSGRKEIVGIAADYMNILGDPFSYFVYKTKKDKYSTYRKNIVKEHGKNVIMRFQPGDVYPLADSATSIMSLDYIKEKYPKQYTSIEFTCGAYDIVLSETQYCAVIKGDNIIHNCSSSLKTYFSKLRFRVVNNLFHKEESGFSSKEAVSKGLFGRKILFCLYALLVPLPVLDSIRLALIYKNPTFLLHFIYVYYVCLQIATYGTIKLLGGERKNTSYGK